MRVANPIPKKFLAGLTVFLAAGMAWADDVAPLPAQQQGDWLKSTQPSNETYRATTGATPTNPFTVLSTGALWQDSRGESYSRKLADSLSLSCEGNTLSAGDDIDLSHNQKAGLQFQPTDAFVFRGEFHDAMSDSMLPGGSTISSGAAFSAEGKLPTQSVLTLGLRSDRTSSDEPAALGTETNACDAQLRQPLGKLPLSAVLKGHLEDTTTGNAPATSLPSLEQSLVWKPLENTTFQAGLRQQQYQEYPGVDHQLNEALFADWSQKVMDNVSWHSYAEVLNSKGLNDQAPASPIASGANGTPQATTPASNPGVTSSMPFSMDDQTITFSTGPSFQLQKDISANFEYSNRWDKNPTAGNTGQEQRVSVSVKGTF